MRLKHAALFVLLFTTVVVGQEEPLPVVTPRITPPEPEVVLVALPVEPMREPHSPTLAEAARANAYATFDALYREAKQQGNAASPFDTLHELWTYSVTDPVGAFYGPELHERLARAYPGFAQYIEEHRLVDNNGNVFYPTSETRAFVLARALQGSSAPRALLAANDENAPAPRVQPKRAAAEERVASEPAQKTAAAAPKEAAAPARAAAAPPVVIRAAETPAAETPAASDAAVSPAAAPAPAPAVVTAAAATSVPQNSPAGRGLLLIVVGIMAAGLLAVMLRTRETVPAVVAHVEPEPLAPQQEELPEAPVEPIRRPAARAANRASGSRG